MTSELTSLGPDAIVGSYRIVKEIGRGGMGSVYEAVHTVLPRRAAIKVMHGDLRRQPGMATRMVQEAAILEDVRHAGIVRVFECNILPDQRPWIAMELVLGETLAQRLQYQSTLPAADLAKLLSEIADILAAVHARGIIHRDLKPDNLLLTPSDPYFPVRLIDWGVARLGPMGRLTLDGLTPGTPIYMSPEQATGKNIAAPCDIYSLGVIAYEALAGHPPFDGRTLAEVVCKNLSREPAPLRDCTTAPRELCELVHRMLDKDPAVRPGAIEVRQIARAIAIELTSAYAEFELSGVEAEPEPASVVPVRPRVPHIPHMAHSAMPSDEVVIVDPDSLEFGVTEMVPIVRKPRWTPEIGHVPSSLAEQSNATSTRAQAITPKASRDQVSGEITLAKRR
ncbi:MAG: serine/threonine protein kinase [Deltaproteobacteria bacterium]|nr:serine/threonine protein kinase [Deltaproteobacteria bacterium]